MQRETCCVGEILFELFLLFSAATVVAVDGALVKKARACYIRGRSQGVREE